MPISASSLPPAASASPAAATATAKTRHAGIDHLRIALTALVILHHTAIVYGGSGGWFWREQPNASQPLLLLFNAINQSYFMGFFFLLAGYYTPPAFDRKGPGRFFVDRLIRLGIPLLVFFFILFPLTVALARTHDGHALWSGWGEMIRTRVYGPGPLWFAEALLLFAAAYLLWRRLRPTQCHPLNDTPQNPPPSPPAKCHIMDDTLVRRSGSLPSFRVLALTAFALGVANFLVRLAIPIGHEVLWLQLGYFPCYIYLFAAGCAASRSRLLESISFRDARPWLIVSAVALLTLPVVIAFRRDAGDFGGGLHFNALYYALWDPFVACGIILGLLWAARTLWARPTSLTAALARNAFGAYIVHPPVVVALSLLASTWTLPALAKFVLVGALACAGSFLVAAPLRMLPGARRVL